MVPLMSEPEKKCWEEYASWREKDVQMLEEKDHLHEKMKNAQTQEELDLLDSEYAEWEKKHEALKEKKLPFDREKSMRAIYRLLRVNFSAELIKKIADEEIQSSSKMKFDNTFELDRKERMEHTRGVVGMDYDPNWECVIIQEMPTNTDKSSTPFEWDVLHECALCEDIITADKWRGHFSTKDKSKYCPKHAQWSQNKRGLDTSSHETPTNATLQTQSDVTTPPQKSKKRKKSSSGSSQIKKKKPTKKQQSKEILSLSNDSDSSKKSLEADKEEEDNTPADKPSAINTTMLIDEDASSPNETKEASTTKKVNNQLTVQPPNKVDKSLADKPPATPTESHVDKEETLIEEKVVKNKLLHSITNGISFEESQKMMEEQSAKAGLSKDILDKFVNDDSIDLHTIIMSMNPDLFKQFRKAQKENDVALQLFLVFQNMKFNNT